VAGKERYRKSVAIKGSCPGIGELTAIRLTLELGDLRRFPDGKQLGSYVGLAGSEHSTGERVRQGGITRQGRSCLRSWLVESSWVAIRKDPALLRKYDSILGRRGSGKVAIVGVARKLIGRIRAIELKGEPYRTGVIR
jgi:transposase